MTAFPARLIHLALLILVWPALAQAQPAQEDFADLFEPKSLGLETFRDREGRYALQLVHDPQSGLALAAFAVVHPRENREVQITEARSFAYDPAQKALRLTFAGNDGGIREVAGVLGAADRAFHVVRSFRAKMIFDGGVTHDVVLLGGQIRPKGKRGCSVDAFPGANMALLTLKAPFDPQAGEWVRETATRESWTVLRRRIDYQKGEDDFDIATLPGREMSAIGAIAGMPRVTCFSFGVDDTEGADAVRILDLKAGTLFTGAGGEEPRPLAELGALFQTPRVDGEAAGVEMEGGGAAPLLLTLVAKGKFFGFEQGQDVSHRVSLSVRIGRSPGKTGDFAESLRFIVRSVARAGPDGKFEPLSLRGPNDSATLEAVQIWQTAFGADLASAIGGTVN